MCYEAILMNPPYDKNLHLKILEQSYPMLTDDGILVNLSPIRWLQDPLAKYKKTSDYYKFKEVRERVEELLVVDQEAGSLMFDILLNTNLGVYVIRKNTINTGVSLVEIRGQHIIDKIQEKMVNGNILSFKDVCESRKVDGWRVRVNELQPLETTDGRDLKTNKWRHWIINPNTKTYVYKDGYTKDGEWWSTLTQNGKWVKKVGEPLPFSIKFENESKAINFEASCKTTFMNALKNLMQIDLHVPLGYLPYMGECINPRTRLVGYEGEWFDEDLCKYFGITDSEWEEIVETMKPYL